MRVARENMLGWEVKKKIWCVGWQIFLWDGISNFFRSFRSGENFLPYPQKIWELHPSPKIFCHANSQFLLPCPWCCPFRLDSVSKFVHELSAFKHLCMSTESPMCNFTLPEIFKILKYILKSDFGGFCFDTAK